MKKLYAFARRFFGVAGSILLLMSALWVLDSPPDLPGWRRLLGLALACAAAIVFEHFSTDKEDIKKCNP